MESLIILPNYLLCTVSQNNASAHDKQTKKPCSTFAADSLLSISMRIVCNACDSTLRYKRTQYRRICFCWLLHSHFYFKHRNPLFYWSEWNMPHRKENNYWCLISRFSCNRKAWPRQAKLYSAQKEKGSWFSGPPEYSKSTDEKPRVFCCWRVSWKNHRTAIRSTISC